MFLILCHLQGACKGRSFCCLFIYFFIFTTLQFFSRTDDQHNSTWHRQITLYSFVVPFFNLCHADNEFCFNLFGWWMLLGLPSTHSLVLFPFCCLLMIIFNSKVFRVYFLLVNHISRCFCFFLPVFVFLSTFRGKKRQRKFLALASQARCIWR
jgi:hypothetical protein